MTDTQIQPRDSQGSVWEDRWKTKFTPWDRAAPHGALVNLLKDSRAGYDGPAIPASGTALIPGCGKGYDVLLLAEHGLDTLGVDIAPTAVEEARSWIAAQPHDEVSNRGGKAEVREASFFDLPRPDDGFAVMYDYTFLCALPPALRPQWAETYTRLSSPTSLLITLQSPLDGDRRGGPPYSVGLRDKPNEVYEQLLGSDWEMCYSRAIRAEEHRKIGIDAGAQGDEGRERIAIWKRKQTTSKI